MRGIARASALAVVLVGCGTKWWLLIPIDASIGSQPDESAFDAVAEAAGSDAIPSPFYCDNESACSQLAWHCDLRGHVCVECLTDSDCTQPGALHCDPRNKCVMCLPLPTDTCGPGQRCDETWCFYSCPDGGGCPPVAPLCNTSFSRFVCASCLTNDDCADAAVPSICNHNKGQCEESDQVIVRPPGPDASSDALDASDVSAEAPSVGDAADGGG